MTSLVPVIFELEDKNTRIGRYVNENYTLSDIMDEIKRCHSTSMNDYIVQIKDPLFGLIDFDDYYIEINRRKLSQEKILHLCLVPLLRHQVSTEDQGISGFGLLLPHTSVNSTFYSV
ncbi:unnamed protein product [Didymodactylos carnosus]|uniref:Uncharacterized protein n=1 Tax=Didymodactylos carnosus TaxID=1234261 RepID=A0A813V2R6_9BILA|nr:unnamed protein product [Didymodactylos carnosus]CAF3618937.1 unnamed protein product [Didymodactylos carnosus]